MANSKIIISVLLAFVQSLAGQNNSSLISIGAHENGVSIGEPVVYNKGKINIGFLNRFKASSFSSDFYLSNDTICQGELTSIVLIDSSFLSSKTLTLKSSSGNEPIVTVDTIFNAIDTGWYPYELTVKLGRKRRKSTGGFYVKPTPTFVGSDTVTVCQEANTFYLTPEVDQCINCAFTFPNASASLDSVQLTITKDTLYTFGITNQEGCFLEQSIWYDYNLTPTISPINASINICNGDTVPIGFQTNGFITVWSSHFIQGNVDLVFPSITTNYYANSQSYAGCLSKLDTITVTVNQLPIISLQDSNYVCVGLTEQLAPQISGASPFQFLWSNGESTQNITIPDNTSSYTLTVTDDNLCVETHTIFNNLIDYVLDAGENDSICFGDTYDFQPYQGSYMTSQWSIANDSLISSQLFASASPELSTWYTLTTSNDSGCVKTDSVFIAVDSLSTLSYSIVGLTDLKIGDTLSFVNTNVEQSHIYNWSIDGSSLLGQSDSVYWTPIYEGNYTLTLEGINSLNCPIERDSIFYVRDIAPRDYERIVYPNPTQGVVSYNYYSSEDQAVQIDVLDELGRIISSASFDAVEGLNIFRFDLSGAAAGKYYFLLSSEKETLKANRPWVIKI